MFSLDISSDLPSAPEPVTLTLEFDAPAHSPSQSSSRHPIAAIAIPPSDQPDPYLSLPSTEFISLTARNSSIADLLAQHRLKQSSAREIANAATENSRDDVIDLRAYTSEPPSSLLSAPAPALVSQLSDDPAIRSPWSRREYIHPNFTLRLHEELIDFVHYVSPKADEQQKRERLVGRLTSLVQSIWPSASVRVFGSFATGLYLPISDIDIVIFGSFDSPSSSALNQIADKIRHQGWASYLEVIAKARIPIVKYTDKETNIRVDISRDIEGGLLAADFIKSMQQQFPPLKPLTLFLKFFLHCRGLNETFTGGVGSFMLQLMILSMIQLNPAKAADLSLGSLLYSFFELYGRNFNYQHIGIDVNGQGSYYRKADRGWYNKERPYLMSIVNPLDPEHDVGQNSYAILRVRKAFQFAFNCLSSRQVVHGNGEKERNGNSLLSRLLTVEEDMFALRPVDDGEAELDAEEYEGFFEDRGEHEASASGSHSESSPSHSDSETPPKKPSKVPTKEELQQMFTSPVKSTSQSQPSNPQPAEKQHEKQKNQGKNATSNASQPQQSNANNEPQAAATAVTEESRPNTKPIILKRSRQPSNEELPPLEKPSAPQPAANPAPAPTTASAPAAASARPTAKVVSSSVVPASSSSSRSVPSSSKPIDSDELLFCQPPSVAMVSLGDYREIARAVNAGREDSDSEVSELLGGRDRGAAKAAKSQRHDRVQFTQQGVTIKRKYIEINDEEEKQSKKKSKSKDSSGDRNQIIDLSTEDTFQAVSSESESDDSSSGWSTDSENQTAKSAGNGEKHKGKDARDVNMVPNSQEEEEDDDDEVEEITAPGSVNSSGETKKSNETLRRNANNKKKRSKKKKSQQDHVKMFSAPNRSPGNQPNQLLAPSKRSEKKKKAAQKKLRKLNKLKQKNGTA